MMNIKDGLTDYLEIMQYAGVSALPRSGSSGRTADRELEKKEVKSEELRVKSGEVPVSKSEQLQQLAAEVAQCKRCPVLVNYRTQTVFGTGNPDAELMFLGEAPGADEDKQGVPFVGRAGQLLTDIIEKGMKLRREDVYICNILRCRPPNNAFKDLHDNEPEHCRPFLNRTLDIIKPKYICCLGTVAAQNLLRSDIPISRMRGNVYDYNGIKVVCTFHPAYLLRNPSAKNETWQDIKVLMKEMGLM
ncbi:MAG: uracil-DNA glycosylase [Planctomycetaceae bacterium]|jgi:DNA polymerase|nr:uracil-DNA glycosylase [Planctomycetaceae bacterium]